MTEQAAVEYEAHILREAGSYARRSGHDRLRRRI